MGRSNESYWKSQALYIITLFKDLPSYSCSFQDQFGWKVKVDIRCLEVRTRVWWRVPSLLSDASFPWEKSRQPEQTINCITPASSQADRFAVLTNSLQTVTYTKKERLLQVWVKNRLKHNVDPQLKADLFNTLCNQSIRWVQRWMKILVDRYI